MTDTVVLTGISGFIAKHVALKLLGAGYAVRGSLRDPSRAEEVRAALAPHLDAAALARLSFVPLDLMDDAGWAEAMQGACALIHTASPFPIAAPKHEDDLIRPAVDGTQRAMAAAKAAGVGRVILTSSVAAIIDTYKRGMQDETDWCQLDAPDTSAYSTSKTLAERAAWDFATAQSMALTTINPGFVLGPPLDAHYGSSISVVARLLRGRDPMLPDLSFTCVDVRDVAEAHLRALQRPQTAGRRIPCTAGVLSMPDMGRVLRAAYPARKIATRKAPMIALRAMALFDPAIRAILPNIGAVHHVSNARARQDLDLRFVSPEGALRASADWLIANGAV
ncbi:MAG: NAD-dependent epimerase/dehydratase family protein [Cypionkella sp.]|nr:NAD-dependent epimerase/dehydratase family protein [Cypionkella sp.]